MANTSSSTSETTVSISSGKPGLHSHEPGDDRLPMTEIDTVAPTERVIPESTRTTDFPMNGAYDGLEEDFRSENSESLLASNSSLSLDVLDITRLVDNGRISFDALDGFTTEATLDFELNGIWDSRMSPSLFSFLLRNRLAKSYMTSQHWSLPRLGSVFQQTRLCPIQY